MSREPWMAGATARIYCDNCGHDYLLAFSCKARYFCPSCHQKRMLAYGEWVEENVLAPVPHRQYVFSLPKLLRPWFRHDRARLGKLCQLVAKLMVQGYQALDPRGKPGFMLYVQTFGDLVTFNPHIHALVADGVFYPSGSFRVLPPIPDDALREALRHRILDFLCDNAGLDSKLAERMRLWQHSGFSVHNRIRVKTNDAEGRKQLARYMIRNPFALEKMTYDGNTGMVVYRSKFHASLKRNYQLLPAVKWLTLLLPTSRINTSTSFAITAGTVIGHGGSAILQPNPRTATPPSTWTKHHRFANPKPTGPGSSRRSTRWILSNAPNATTPCASSLSLTMPPSSAAYSNTCVCGKQNRNYQTIPHVTPMAG